MSVRRNHDSCAGDVTHTSGTTARPKGAMMTHQALAAEYVSCVIALDFTPQDNPLIAMPLYHSAAMHVFLLPYLSIGASVHLMPGPDVPEILRLSLIHI